MHNLVYLIGRLTSDPQVKETDNGGKVAHASLAVTRSYKNENGEYETDFIDCVLFNGIASNTAEYCKKGDLVGIKGRLQVRDYEVDGEKKKTTEVICDKISFLASKKPEMEESVEQNNDMDM